MGVSSPHILPGGWKVYIWGGIPVIKPGELMYNTTLLFTAERKFTEPFTGKVKLEFTLKPTSIYQDLPSLKSPSPFLPPSPPLHYCWECVLLQEGWGREQW